MLTPCGHRSARLSNGSAGPQSVPAMEANRGELLDDREALGLPLKDPDSTIGLGCHGENGNTSFE